MYFGGCDINGGGCDINSGGWNMDDAKRSYEKYNLSHGKTPGSDGGSGGGGGGGGGYTIGRIARQMFFLVLICGLLTFASSGTPLLAVLGVSIGLAAGFALVTYGILRLIERVLGKRR